MLKQSYQKCPYFYAKILKYRPDYRNFNIQTRTWLDILTRGTIGFLQGLCLISIPLTKHNWIIYNFCLVGIILSQSLLSWRYMNTINFRGIKLNKVDVLNYSIITGLALIIIYY